MSTPQPGPGANLFPPRYRQQQPHPGYQPPAPPADAPRSLLDAGDHSRHGLDTAGLLANAAEAQAREDHDNAHPDQWAAKLFERSRSRQEDQFNGRDTPPAAPAPSPGHAFADRRHTSTPPTRAEFARQLFD